MRAALFALVFLCSATGRAAQNPLRDAVEKASCQISKGTRLVAAIYPAAAGAAGNRLRVYRVSDGRYRLVYLEPSSVMSLSFSSIHAGGDIPDLAGDGSRILAYSATFPGTNQQALIVLRLARGKLERLGDYPFASFEDVDGDGKPELVARARPLGQFFAVECESFRSMAQAAFQTRIYSWSGGRLERSSARYPDYLQAHINELERELAATDPRKTENYGDYLGNALSLYFDNEELGRGREGWRRFTSLFPVRFTDPPMVKRCVRQMEGSVRRILRIPEDW